MVVALRNLFTLERDPLSRMVFKIWLFHSWTVIKFLSVLVYCLMIFVYGAIVELLRLVPRTPKRRERSSKTESDEQVRRTLIFEAPYGFE